MPISTKFLHAVVGAFLAIGGVTASDEVQGQTTEYTLVSGQVLIVRLVRVRVNTATLEMEELFFEEPLASGKWRANGCRMKMADHPHLQQALQQRGFLLKIYSQARGGCIQSYEIGRDENLISQATAAPPGRTPTLVVTGTGILPPRPTFTPIRSRTQTFTITATGALTPRAPFTPVIIRTDTLTVTGTGSL